MINSNEILHEVYNIFSDNNLPYEYSVFGRFVNVSVEDGHWKSDHLKLKRLMAINGFVCIEDASFENEDCCGETYSSNYTFIKARV